MYSTKDLQEFTCRPLFRYTLEGCDSMSWSFVPVSRNQPYTMIVKVIDSTGTRFKRMNADSQKKILMLAKRCTEVGYELISIEQIKSTELNANSANNSSR